MAKGGSAPAPDYGPVIQANREQAAIAKQIADEQLAWAKETYAQDKATTDELLGVLMPAMKSEASAATAMRDRYTSVFQPLEDRFIADATSYDTPQRQEAEAGRAIADVTQAFDAQRKGALAQLESYGVDPSTLRSGALDRGVRVAQAAVTAGAANASRLATEATGRALVGEAINIGRGYPGQIAQAYGTAQQAGQGGLGSRLQTTASGSATMGSPIQWTGANQGYLSGWNQNLGGMGQIYKVDQERAAANQAGIGAMVGGAVGLAGRMFMPGSGAGSFLGTALGMK